MEDVLAELYEQKIISVLVEGGQQIHNAFIASGLWDEARVFQGKMMFSQGVKAPVIDQSPEETLQFEGSKLDIFYNQVKIH
jgi:diaminohydroxyphosphoribosylaminopyrimidine deaminase / 5-amino-6-(5-phosphoribosylamino)uracil reductase